MKERKRYFDKTLNGRGQNADGSPASFFLEDSETWYWTGGVIRLDEGPLISFLYRIKSTPGVGPGFANSGYALAIIKNPDQPPSAWKPVIINARQSAFDAVPATAIVRDGIYVVGLAFKPGIRSTYIFWLITPVNTNLYNPHF